jgi:hypothetical protein
MSPYTSWELTTTLSSARPATEQVVVFDLKPIAGYPALSERACGWLRFLDRKVHVSDDWSRNGQLSELWDRTSTPPMMSFPRFDLLDSSYAVTPMADMALLRAAGCELEDLERMTGQDGEATLERLRRSGVYVTFDEFKGRAPIVRGEARTAGVDPSHVKQ